jgi:thiamine pyrophosphate-dependent acetolactate synthase large subunit-like protein
MAAVGTVTITVGELLARVLAVQGVDAVYGEPLPGVHVTAVPADAAPVLATAHTRVFGTPAAVHCDGTLTIGAGGPPHVVRAGADLLDALPDDATVRIEIDVFAGAPDVVPPAPAHPDGWRDPEEADVAPLAAASAPAVLAGPGVVHDGAVAGLNAFATAGDVGVLNTWGAKGVFHWRSRHHWATVGLQAEDFHLGGLASADLIVATGIDPDEAPDGTWQVAPVLPVEPALLAPLAERWRRPARPLEVPPLRAGLAAVTQDGWASTSVPLAPSRVTMHYGQVFGRGGLVAADAGTAGYWVARTFSTTELGTVHVPARPIPGFAAACALVARLRQPARPVLAVVDRVDEATSAVLHAAATLGVPVPLEVWTPDGVALGPDAHLARLRHLALAPGQAARPVVLATDLAQLPRMVDVAGPVIAWGGLR